MSWVRAFLRRVARRIVGEREQPRPVPDRLRATAEDFARLNPHATRAEWIEMSSNLAAEAYRTGLSRGWEESVRRDLDLGPSPEEIADAIDPDWREPERGIDPVALARKVPDEYDVDEVTREAIEEARLMAMARER